MPMFIDSPSGRRPPKLERSIGLWMAIAGPGRDIIAKGCVPLMLGVPVYALTMWWRGRESAQEAIPEASAQAQVQAAHRREAAMA
jgi:hypothetical protein